jgi:AbrB family looped-hinge helix DNA binding protein
MPKVRARVSSKGQITIPKEVRECLGLEHGSTVEFEVEDGKATIRQVESGFLRFGGSVTPRNRPEDWAAVREEVALEVARKVVERDR